MSLDLLEKSQLDLFPETLVESEDFSVSNFSDLNKENIKDILEKSKIIEVFNEWGCKISCLNISWSTNNEYILNLKVEIDNQEVCFDIQVIWDEYYFEPKIFSILKWPATVRTVKFYNNIQYIIRKSFNKFSIYLPKWDLKFYKKPVIEKNNNNNNNVIKTEKKEIINIKLWTIKLWKTNVDVQFNKQKSFINWWEDNQEWEMCFLISWERFTLKFTSKKVTENSWNHNTDDIVCHYELVEAELFDSRNIQIIKNQDLLNWIIWDKKQHINLSWWNITAIAWDIINSQYKYFKLPDNN